MRYLTMASNYSFAQFAQQTHAKSPTFTLRPSLDNVDIDADHSHIRLPTTSQFQVHPLVAIEHFIAERNVNNVDHYPRFELFSDDCYGENPHRTIKEMRAADIPNYVELQSLVNEAIEYFRTECVMIKLQNEYVSDWLDTVMTALNDMDQKRLNNDHLKAVCKLVPFYLFNKKIMTASDSLHLNSVRDIETGKTEFKKFKRLKLIYKQHLHNAANRDQLAYFFQTQSNHLLQVNVRELSLRSTILKLSYTIDLDISFRKRTMYSSNFSYMVSQNIQEVSA